MDATTRRTGLVVSTAFAEHLTGSGHPERPDRTAAIVEPLEADGLLARARVIEPRAATDDDILRCHTPGYLEIVKEDVAEGVQRLSTGDTHQHPLYPGTGQATETGDGPGEGRTLNCPFAASHVQALMA